MSPGTWWNECPQRVPDHSSNLAESGVYIAGYSVHMDVGVRELKQHLSEYLDRAAAGEHLVVTDRGVPKALIGPVPGGRQLERGVDEGWVRPAVRSGALPHVRRVTGTARVLDSLAEDRNA